jgi:hypothetical protein
MTALWRRRTPSLSPLETSVSREFRQRFPPTDCRLQIATKFIEAEAPSALESLKAALGSLDVFFQIAGAGVWEKVVFAVPVRLVARQAADAGY